MDACESWEEMLRSRSPQGCLLFWGTTVIPPVFPAVRREPWETPVRGACSLPRVPCGPLEGTKQGVNNILEVKLAFTAKELYFR